MHGLDLPGQSVGGLVSPYTAYYTDDEHKCIAQWDSSRRFSDLFLSLHKPTAWAGYALTRAWGFQLFNPPLPALIKWNRILLYLDWYFTKSLPFYACPSLKRKSANLLFSEAKVSSQNNVVSQQLYLKKIWLCVEDCLSETYQYSGNVSQLFSHKCGQKGNL